MSAFQADVWGFALFVGVVFPWAIYLFCRAWKLFFTTRGR